MRAVGPVHSVVGGFVEEAAFFRYDVLVLIVLNAFPNPVVARLVG